MNEPGMTLHPALFRKRPVTVEAVLWGGGEIVAQAIVEWITTLAGEHDAWFTTYGICIRTLEGVMTASPGDWIVRGTQGEFYPCKPDAFAATFEEAGQDEQLLDELSARIEVQGPGLEYRTVD